MFTEQLKDLERVSQAVGNSPDLVQGGGGNTSVKLDDKLMAVKASGFKMKEITPTEGYVVVNYKNIKLTMEETLMGFIYVVENIERNHLPLKTMSDKETDFIQNWESKNIARVC